MDKFLIYLIFALTAQVTIAEGISLLPVTIHSDEASLQRGAKIYMNYCAGCHSLRYLRYNRLAKDLGLTTFTGQIDTNLLFNNLIFTSAKLQDPIQISMPKKDALRWFGKEPPDLSLKARERGANWIYTYLKSFYFDVKRPFGSNNLLLPEAAMPNVLEPLIGKVVLTAPKTEAHSLDQLLLIKSGEMTQEQFDSTVTDLVSFLVYVSEPNRLTRHHIGIFVLIFLAIFTIFAYLLKKLYWKNIH